MRFLFFLSTLLFVQLAFPQKENLKTLSHLDKDLDEISGMEILSGSDLFWGVNDAGNKNIVYGFDESGSIQKEVEITNAENVDWEDLTKDDHGTLFIGDFGNNKNDRKDLAIYVISDFVNQGKKAKAEKIEFTYEDQTDFDPDKDEMVYGCEAFIYFKDNLYLFTKNRSKHDFGYFDIYKIPATPGKHTARKIGSQKTCDDEKTNCWITSATMNPARDVLFLNSNTSLWKFSEFEGDNFFDGKSKHYSLGDEYTQKESVTYKDETHVYLSDEETKHDTGRNLYEFEMTPAECDCERK